MRIIKNSYWIQYKLWTCPAMEEKKNTNNIFQIYELYQNIDRLKRSKNSYNNDKWKEDVHCAHSLSPQILFQYTPICNSNIESVN